MEHFQSLKNFQNFIVFLGLTDGAQIRSLFEQLFQYLGVPAKSDIALLFCPQNMDLGEYYKFLQEFSRSDTTQTPSNGDISDLDGFLRMLNEEKQVNIYENTRKM